MNRWILAGAFVLAPLLAAVSAAADETTTGDWAIQRAVAPGTVHFELREGTRTNGVSHWDSAHDIELAKLGLPAADFDSEGRHVQFALAREAGSFACDGWVKHGGGAGTFTFTPSQVFLDGMRRRGYADLTPEKRLTSATVDLTLSYVDGVAGAGFPHLELNQLIAFRALSVTPDSIAELRKTFGTNDLSAEEVTSLAALRVTPAYLQELRSAGISGVSPRKAVELKALGIDRAYIDELAKAGYPNLGASQLVQMKALRIDAAYIRHLSEHGLKNLSISQLVQLKAVGM